MKIIDINNWERKEYFEFFYRMDYPQFVVRYFLKFIRPLNKLSFNTSVVFQTLKNHEQEI